jgi:hypothetical protein
MQSRWFTATVIVLWLVTMSWLVREKVLPPLLRGEPPNYGDIAKAQLQKTEVGWEILFNNRVIGWALTDAKAQQATGLTEIRGRVHFDRLPLDEMLSGWLQPLTGIIDKRIENLKVDVRSVLTLDPLGHLIRVDSVARFEPSGWAVWVRGTVEAGQLQLQFHTENVTVPYEMALPPDALLSNLLQPQFQLPHLRLGQTWTVPVCTPFWPQKCPIDVAHATVESDDEPVQWNGATERAWLVAYRDEPTGKVGDGQGPRARIWVRKDPEGTVVKQEMRLPNSALLTFYRLSDADAKKRVDKATKADGQWWYIGNEPQGKRHD